jgi:hypothetical protein
MSSFSGSASAHIALQPKLTRLRLDLWACQSSSAVLRGTDFLGHHVVMNPFIGVQRQFLRDGTESRIRASASSKSVP